MSNDYILCCFMAKIEQSDNISLLDNIFRVLIIFFIYCLEFVKKIK